MKPLTIIQRQAFFMATFDFGKTVIEGGLSLGGLLKLHNDILAPLASALDLPSIIGDTLPLNAHGLPDVSRITNIKATPIEDEKIIALILVLCLNTFQTPGVEHFFKCLCDRGLLDANYALDIVHGPTKPVSTPTPSIFSLN